MFVIQLARAVGVLPSSIAFKAWITVCSLKVPAFMWSPLLCAIFLYWIQPMLQVTSGRCFKGLIFSLDELKHIFSINNYLG